jgi:hypothetical protein
MNLASKQVFASIVHNLARDAERLFLAERGPTATAQVDPLRTVNRASQQWLMCA